MKILLICAGGASTSILMKKMEKYAEGKGIDLKISAKGIGEYQDYYKEYDLILLGPQISYQKDNIKAVTKLPLAVITPYDYAIGNAENIFKLVETIYPNK
jgi:PTS system cellobiose-specific IIB component